MAVKPTHFTGQHERPLLPEEAAQRRPVLGSGARPAELEQIARRRRIYVRVAEAGQPRADFAQVEDVLPKAAESPYGLWRIDLPAEVHGPVGLPGRSALRYSP